jgi:prophage regulatory protein
MTFSESIKRLNETKATVGLSRSTIYAMVKSGNFPKPISLGPRSVGWLSSELDEWIKQRIQQSARR